MEQMLPRDVKEKLNLGFREGFSRSCRILFCSVSVTDETNAARDFCRSDEE